MNGQADNVRRNITVISMSKSTINIYLLGYFVLFSLYGYGQKYKFYNYSSEQGLIQSQAMGFCQDNYRNLWVCTDGGVSRFEGKDFTGFDEPDGLMDNFTTCIYAEDKNRIWIGTRSGLSVFEGN
jgi:hypothetical protein